MCKVSHQSVDAIDKGAYYVFVRNRIKQLSRRLAMQHFVMLADHRHQHS